MKAGKSLAITAILLLVPFLSAQNPKAVYFDRQEVLVPDFPAEGFILDIGGGGEGVIGQLKGNQVISVDPYKEELQNAPSTNLKIVMDGRDLKFIDNSFNTAAIFYTLMYISGDDHPKVFQEVKRVLKHGGRLLIWDVNLPVWKDGSKEFGVYRFKFKLPKREIVTGYGAKFPKSMNQDLQYYIQIAQKEGYKVITARNNEPSFFIELQTPPSITEVMEKVLAGKNVESALKIYDELKGKSKDEYHFGADVLMDLSNRLIASGRMSDSAAVFKLALRDFSIEENKTNAFGYQLLNAKRYADAADILKINTEKFATSANAFDSLAEAYMMNGQKDLAIKYYEKSLALNPENGNAIEMLKKLKS